MAQRHRPTKRATTWWLTIPLTVLALTAAACGGDDDEDEAQDGTTTTAGSSSTSAEEPAIEDLLAEYETCMSDAGAPVATNADTVEALIDAAGSPPEVATEMGVPQEVVDAHRSCGADVEAALDAGATLPEEDPDEGDTTSTTVDAESAAQMHEAVACLNDRGWDFLEPGVEAGPLEMAPRDPGFNWDDPAFLDDQRECQQQAGMMP
jgi:hypothetical protein